MDKITMTIELSYDAESMHGNEQEGIEWFYTDVLAGELLLHSNEIGDSIGSVRVIDILPEGIKNVEK